jgi:hypothetical protein
MAITALFLPADAQVLLAPTLHKLTRNMMRFERHVPDEELELTVVATVNNLEMPIIFKFQVIGLTMAVGTPGDAWHVDIFLREVGDDEVVRTFSYSASRYMGRFLPGRNSSPIATP